MKKIYGIGSVLMVLTACASGPDLDKMSADELYNYAFDQLEATRYKKAAEAFEKVETDHPYSKWAVKSKLMGAYAYYKDEKYDDAVIATERFLRYHPGNKDAAYAYYLKGMCYYDQISAADRDQGDTQKAEDTFARLIALYPNSEYAEDVRNKVNLTEDYKAGQEMIIGRFYLKEGNYLSALNRFNVVLNEYQSTIQIEEALYRQVEIYAIFGMNRYADGYYQILQKNYPEGKWTAKAARVMEKIGGKDGTEKQKSWSSKWKEKKADEKNAATDASDEDVAEVKEADEESKSWFSGWFGGDDDKVEKANEKEVAEALAPSKSLIENDGKNAAEKVKTEPEKEDKSWFGGWFGSDDAAKEAAAPVEEAKATAEEQAEEGKSWFGGWFGSDDAAKEVAAPVEEAKATAEEQAEEDKSWFSGWFGGDDAAKEAAAPVEEAKATAEEQAEEDKSWFSGWFSGDEAKEVKAPVVEEVKAESETEAENTADNSGSDVKSWLNSWFASHSNNDAK